MTIFAEIDLLLYPRWARIQLDLAKARQMTSSARSARRGGDIVEWLISHYAVRLIDSSARGELTSLCQSGWMRAYLGYKSKSISAKIVIPYSSFDRFIKNRQKSGLSSI